MLCLWHNIVAILQMFKFLTATAISRYSNRSFFFFIRLRDSILGFTLRCFCCTLNRFAMFLRCVRSHLKKKKKKKIFRLCKPWHILFRLGYYRDLIWWKLFRIFFSLYFPACEILDFLLCQICLSINYVITLFRVIWSLSCLYLFLSISAEYVFIVYFLHYFSLYIYIFFLQLYSLNYIPFVYIIYYTFFVLLTLIIRLVFPFLLLFLFVIF